MSVRKLNPHIREDDVIVLNRLLQPKKRLGIGEARREQYVSEQKFQAMVEELAGYCGWTTFHVNLPMRSPAGFPDLVMFRERIIFAELKSRSPRTGRAGKLRPVQTDYANTIMRAGGEYYSWLYPDQWDEIVEVLKR